MEPLEVLRHVVVLVHLSGFAVVFGAWAAQVATRTWRVSRIMDWGLAISLLSGLVLAAPWGIDHPLNYVKLGVKLVVLVVIGGLLGMGSARQRRGGDMPRGAFWLVGVLALLNAGLAVIWR